MLVTLRRTLLFFFLVGPRLSGARWHHIHLLNRSLYPVSGSSQTVPTIVDTRTSRALRAAINYPRCATLHRARARVRCLARRSPSARTKTKDSFRTTITRYTITTFITLQRRLDASLRARFFNAYVYVHTHTHTHFDVSPHHYGCCLRPSNHEKTFTNIRCYRVRCSLVPFQQKDNSEKCTSIVSTATTHQP